MKFCNPVFMEHPISMQLNFSLYQKMVNDHNLNLNYYIYLYMSFFYYYSFFIKLSLRWTYFNNAVGVFNISLTLSIFIVY